MQPLTIAGRDPGGVIIAFQGRKGARAVSTPLFVSRRLLPIALVCAAQLAASGSVRADPVPETMNGVPFLPIPTFEEVGLPPFTMPTGTLSTVPEQTAPPNATGSDGTSSATLDKMLSQSWGAAAGANAESLGVTPRHLPQLASLRATARMSAVQEQSMARSKCRMQHTMQPWRPRSSETQIWPRTSCQGWPARMTRQLKALLPLNTCGRVL